MTIRGLVTKSYNNFFDVTLLESGGPALEPGTVLESHLRGRFRQDGEWVITGDVVGLSVSWEGNTPRGQIEEIQPRASRLYRPPIANVSQVVIVFTLEQPAFNSALLDRQLVLAEAEELSALLCLNKADLVEPGDIEAVREVYEELGYPLLATSAINNTGTETLREALSHGISVFAGQSGVGKSSLINRVIPGHSLAMGRVSKRHGRGKHTTRHVELLALSADGWVADTPGFNYLELTELEPADLTFLFPELERLLPSCRFANCLHDQEPGCAVREAVEEGLVTPQRYANYLTMLNELRQREANRY